jgi:tartrate dehydrogenase/decarboxylase/D-malate dehydrogenase
VHRGTPHEVALQEIVFTRMGTERIVRYAYELAREQGRTSVQSVTKSNAMQFSAVFWDDVVEEVAREYPSIRTDKYLVDAMAARFVTDPESLEVVVASNLFADILTDLGGAIQGSMGMPPSANINPTRKHPSLFEPVHGSAPDIAGKGIANPLGTVWAGQMMLDFLGEREAAKLLMRAMEAVTSEGKTLTRDVGGSATTSEVGDAVVEQVRRLSR